MSTWLPHQSPTRKQQAGQPASSTALTAARQQLGCTVGSLTCDIQTPLQRRDEGEDAEDGGVVAGALRRQLICRARGGDHRGANRPAGTEEMPLRCHMSFGGRGYEGAVREALPQTRFLPNEVPQEHSLGQSWNLRTTGSRTEAATQTVRSWGWAWR